MKVYGVGENGKHFTVERRVEPSMAEPYEADNEKVCRQYAQRPAQVEIDEHVPQGQAGIFRAKASRKQNIRDQKSAEYEENVHPKRSVREGVVERIHR